MFKEDSDIDTEFLPKIHFKNLWQCDISENTRETIWKYLQLITFSIVGTLNNKEAFGDAAKLFEAINQDDFKSKLEETLSNMQNLFDSSGNLNENESPNQHFNMKDIPDPTKLQEHITGMLDGKLGQLAREIAEETATNLNIDFENSTDMKDIFQKLVKNPTKLMGLVKNVGDKLDKKMKTGEIKESELIMEATEIMNKMKNMPGMENMQSIFSKFGLGGASGGKMNTAAMEANLNQRMKLAKMKERMQAKAEANSKAKSESTNQPEMQQSSIPDEELLKLFSSSEKAEKTPRGSNPLNNNKQNNDKKKKKGKK
jgi:hypothetical protein